MSAAGVEDPRAQGRRPWLSWALAGSCLAAFLLTSGVRDPVAHRARAELAAAHAWWLAHPYLEPPALLRTFQAQEGGAGAEAWSPSPLSSLIPQPVRDSEQDELEARVEAARALMERHPWSRYGLEASRPSALGALAHLFLHARWRNLMGSVLFLLLAGPVVERRWGRRALGLVALGSGLLGAALFVWRHPASTTPLVGAAAAVSGLMAALLVQHREVRIRLPPSLGGPAGGPSLPVGWIPVLWLLQALFLPVSSALVQPAAATSEALLGGALFGALLSSGRRRHEEKARPVRAAEGQGPRVPSGPLLLQLIQAGQRPQALVAWRGGPREELAAALEPIHLLRLAGWLRDAGQPGPAIAALHLALPRADAATSMRLARAARRLDPVLALRAAERALAQPGVSGHEREALQRQLPALRESISARGIVVLPEAPEAPAVALEGDGVREEGGVQVAEVEPAPTLGSDRSAPEVFDPSTRELPQELEEPAADGLADGGEIEEPAATDEATQVFALGEPAAEDAAGTAQAPASPAEKAPSAQCPQRLLRVRPALPRSLRDGILELELPGLGPSQLPLAKVEAVAVAGIQGLGAGGRAAVLVDLALDWSRPDGPLRVVRLRSDRFDPRTLAEVDSGSPLEAIRAFAAQIVRRARAIPLASAPRQAPLRVFPDLASYEAQVLGARREPL